MTLKTLADVRALLRHLPDGHRERSTWRHVAAQLEQAAAGADPADAAISLRLALMIEGVECRARVHDASAGMNSGRRPQFISNPLGDPAARVPLPAGGRAVPPGYRRV